MFSRLTTKSLCLIQYDHVIVDPKVVSEFERKLEERAKRRNKALNANEDPDLLRDTPRLILFESEKDNKKKKRGRKKKDGGGSKFSKEFLDAMRQVFGDSDDESEESEDEADKGEEKKDDEDAMLRNAGVLHKKASESSLFVGDAREDNREDGDDEEDGINKSRKSVSSNVSRSMRARPTMSKKPKKKKPKIDPADVFAEEMKKQDGVKILSTSGLKQEMADMKKGLTRKMMERELANLRKSTANKFSPFDDKNKATTGKAGRFDDYNATAKSYGPGGAPAEKKPKAKPVNTGLMRHLAKNDDLADHNKLDDLATVAHGLVGTASLPTIANIPSLNDLPGVQLAKTTAKSTLGAISETAAPVLRAATEQTFFSTQNAWDDDESQANVGLTGTNKNSKTGDAPGLTKGQSSKRFKTPQFNFGKRKGSGVQLDDDDEDFRPRPSDY
jgi:hypothetical protein